MSRASVKVSSHIIHFDDIRESEPCAMCNLPLYEGDIAIAYSLTSHDGTVETDDTHAACWNDLKRWIDDWVNSQTKH